MTLPNHLQPVYDRLAPQLNALLTAAILEGEKAARAALIARVADVASSMQRDIKSAPRPIAKAQPKRQRARGRHVSPLATQDLDSRILDAATAGLTRERIAAAVLWDHNTRSQRERVGGRIRALEAEKRLVRTGHARGTTYTTVMQNGAAAQHAVS